MKKSHVENKKSGSKGASKFSIIIFIIGILALAAGGTLLGIKFLSQPATDDAEFLVTSGTWVREDAPSVIWDFTEAGKGKLTTDSHTTDYDFTWTVKDGKLTVETEWLYELSDEFDYTLDQGAKVLTLTVPGKDVKVKFRAE